MRLVLASTSRYRQELLARLGLPFDTVAPGVDETRLPGEAAEHLAARLARAKAAAVRSSFPDAVIIGSDQVAVLGETVLGKPGTVEANVRQLAAASGRRVVFLTGLCVLAPSPPAEQCAVVSYEVTFRRLDRARIERYVALDSALDCAGGFRSEGLGVALFESMRGDDPTALIGLPLIRLSEMLVRVGLDPLGPEEGVAARDED